MDKLADEGDLIRIFRFSACPQCFFLVQRKVHELKEKLIRLKASVGEAKLPQNFTIRNKNFSVALVRIENEAKTLASKIKSLQMEEESLKAFFKSLMDDFDELKIKVNNLETVLTMAFNDSRMARMDIGDAENIIEQIKLLLKDSMYQLDNHGAMAYQEALKLAKDISDLAKQMKNIAAEVSCRLGSKAPLICLLSLIRDFCSWHFAMHATYHSNIPST